MDNLYFGLTKPELIERVAGGDSGAQAELDRRAAKKAAKRTETLSVTAAEHSVLPTINQHVNSLCTILEAMEDEENALDVIEMLREVIAAFNETLAGLPIQ